MKKLLLHTCCGPCFLGVWEDLETSDFEVTNYFYNPNIQPEEEYLSRLENLRKAIRGKTTNLLVDNYEPKEHFAAISGKEAEFPERCLYCYILRLNQTAERAQRENYHSFSTTLLVSPYQRHEDLHMIGNQIGKKYGVEFYYKDWRPFFRVGQNIAKENNIYRQKYCGCIYSKKEANKE